MLSHHSHSHSNSPSHQVTMKTPPTLLLMMILTTISSLSTSTTTSAASNTCRSYCGNLTVDYPFALRPGCGHPGFRDLLFCINDVLMLHITSGSYRVLDVDYAYASLTLHEPHLSTCDSLVLGRRGNGFSVEPWRLPYLAPDPDNVFLLLGCSTDSPLFQGFPGKHLPCRNVSGMGCPDFYACPAWGIVASRHNALGSRSGSGPPECCAVAFEAIRAINLTRLGCEGYSSAYSLAPLRADGADGWSYGIRVRYSVQGNDEFCRACEATGGVCGYGGDGGVRQLCMCGDTNSTSNCDTVKSWSIRRRVSMVDALAGFFIYLSVFG